MVSQRIALVLVLLSALVPDALRAQACLGRPELTGTVGNAELEMRFVDNATGYRASAAAGGALFGSVSGVLYDFADQQDSSLSLWGFGGNAGYELHLGRAIILCPGLGLDVGFGSQNLILFDTPLE